MSKSYNVNTEITAQKVRLLDEQGNQMGVMGIKAALNLADEEGLDLVEISPLADPPVCRMMDYGKFKYQEAKRAAEVRSKQRVVQTKEIKFRPMTDENDYQIKLRSLMRFLNDGDKAKVTLRFRGREMAHQEFGMRLMERVKDDLKDLGVVEQFPRLDGRQMAMVLAPQKPASKQS